MPTQKPRKVRPNRKKAASRKQAAPTNAKPPTKLDKITEALRAPKGATIADLSRLTGWLPHSVRGALAGALKKSRGLDITSSKVGDQRVYKLDSRK